MTKIESTFKRLKQQNKKAFIPYIMAGDPSLEDTKRFVKEIEDAGADIIELGVPFTDPLADGPTIQRAHERALSKGATLRRVLLLIEEIRQKISIPVVLMTYYNPVFKYGVEQFIKEAGRVGISGVIIPDLIPDEAGDFISLARRYKLDTIFLLAPTSTEERIRKVVKVSTGFIYYVSITGITGARILINETMKETLARIKSYTDKPIAVGFGVSDPDEARVVASLADGVIVGSAIVRVIAEGKDVKGFVKSIRDAI